MIKDFQFAINNIKTEKQYLNCLARLKRLGVRWESGDSLSIGLTYFTNYSKDGFFGLIIRGKYDMIWDNEEFTLMECAYEEDLEIITAKDFLKEDNKQKIFIQKLYEKN